MFYEENNMIYSIDGVEVKQKKRHLYNFSEKQKNKRIPSVFNVDFMAFSTVCYNFI